MVKIRAIAKSAGITEKLKSELVDFVFGKMYYLWAVGGAEGEIFCFVSEESIGGIDRPVWYRLSAFEPFDLSIPPGWKFVVSAVFRSDSYGDEEWDWILHDGYFDAPNRGMSPLVDRDRSAMADFYKHATSVDQAERKWNFRQRIDALSSRIPIDQIIEAHALNEALEFEILDDLLASLQHD